MILDTNHAKTKAFAAIAASAGFNESVVAPFAVWQSQNFGVSRYRVFAALMSGQFGAPPVGVDQASLLVDYGRAVDDIYATAPLTSGIEEFIEAFSQTRMFVVSGSEQSQLRRALRDRKFADWFTEIYGSPSSKSELLDHVLNHLADVGLDQPKILYFGDALADLEAARTHGFSFVGLRKYSASPQLLEDACVKFGFPCFESFVDYLSRNNVAPLGDAQMTSHD
ncbi:phosphoglycolate phosphatase-like HAD superfamily hydrolase [Demequina lutea]|uniref:Phosphoglycolate phosphatase-like HAD superfamily hydrolase n=1 Tax=Demequina lutea TaxID=431489 RepID=A0A7Z0CJ66_9MICO|nr:phosphoglycolate phosphatase-like HAD superfamily hydrolase [Demequina lutea]